MMCFKNINVYIFKYLGSFVWKNWQPTWQNSMQSIRKHTYMTWITIDNVQRVETPKAGNSKLRFLCFADIYLHKVSRKYLEQFSSYRVDTNIFQKSHQSSKGHNSKSRLTRVTVFVFCTSSHDALHLCEASLKYLERFSTYCHRADTSTQ